MLGLSAQRFVRPSRPPGAEAVRRALETAGTVSGGYAGAPCTFVALGPDAELALAALRPAGADLGTWVLVAAPKTDEAGHRAHLRERTLTAAQRFMLALACDGIDSQWVADVPSAQAFAEHDLDGRVPVGLVWCAGA